MNTLRALCQGSELEALRQAADHLGRSSEAFAARRMDQSIKHALTGLGLDELADEVEK